MHEHHFAGAFSNHRQKLGKQSKPEDLRGFATNPLASSVTPTQTLMFQAAYQQAQKDLQEPESQLAISWN